MQNRDGYSLSLALIRSIERPMGTLKQLRKVTYTLLDDHANFVVATFGVTTTRKTIFGAITFGVTTYLWSGYLWSDYLWNNPTYSKLPHSFNF
jgi:hypothetical protein